MQDHAIRYTPIEFEDREKSSMGFEGKGVLITGATSGIGAQCARAFAREGAKLVLTGRSTERGEAIVAELSGCHAAFVQSDLGAAEAADALILESVERLGRLDVLVNSAGVIHHRNVSETSDEQWEETIAVNLSAVFYLSRAAVRVMVPAGGRRSPRAGPRRSLRYMGSHARQRSSLTAIHSRTTSSISRSLTSTSKTMAVCCSLVILKFRMK